MKRNELNDIFVAEVIGVRRENENISEENAIYEAFNNIKKFPEFLDNKFFNSYDVEYIKKEVAHVFRIDWTEFDEMVFYNNNLNAVLNGAN